MDDGSTVARSCGFASVWEAHSQTDTPLSRSKRVDHRAPADALLTLLWGAHPTADGTDQQLNACKVVDQCGRRLDMHTGVAIYRLRGSSQLIARLVDGTLG